MTKKNKWLVIGVSAVSILSFSLGAQASGTLEKIQANLNHGIKFVLNGETWSPKNGNGEAIKPISYNATTYVPLRAVAEVTGADVKWDAVSQSISISTGEQVIVRKPFSNETITHVKTSQNSGITENLDELLFGETQYTKAFMVQGVNSAGQKIVFKVKDGTKKVGVTLGFKDTSVGNASYTIGTKESNFATGSIVEGSVTSNTFDVPKGTTELILEFTGKIGGKGKGYLIWDESWTE